MATPAVFMIVDGNKRKHNGKCGVVLTAEEARAEGVSGEVVLRLHEEGKVLGLASDQVCDVSDEAKWVSPLPRSAEAESATDAAFLQFILAASEDAKAQCNWDLPWPQIQEALRAESADALAFAGIWRGILHAKYAEAVECYPDASFTSTMFYFKTSVSGLTNQQTGDNEVRAAFIRCVRLPKPRDEGAAFVKLADAVNKRFKLLNRDHKTASQEFDSWVMGSGGEWVEMPSLCTRDPRNKDWPLPRKPDAPPVGPARPDPEVLVQGLPRE